MLSAAATLCLSGSAKTLKVYSVNGNVTKKDGSAWTKLAKPGTLSDSETIKINPASSIRVLDPATRQIYTFSTESIHSVSALLKQAAQDNSSLGGKIAAESRRQSASAATKSHSAVGAAKRATLDEEQQDALYTTLVSGFKAGTNTGDVKTVYFAPAGNLNLIPMEYFPISSTECFNDRYDAFRLSSTRWLAQRTDNVTPGSVTLYGGVKYDLDESEQNVNEAAADKAAERFFADSFEVGEAETLGLRAGIAYLPATVDEINDIASIFAGSQKSSSRTEGAEATETSIKELSGKEIPVLHVATHGFTVPRKSRSRLGRVLARNDDRSTFEEQSLGRSGLMMAGAANTVDSKDKNAAMKFDDGILTGREISRLDLSNVNTVVLSACESGLGEVGSEGVADLQRGLKKAGVQTLVMSLWKVSDEGTAILMKDFYTNLLSGQNAAQAMRNAQQHLRTMDNGKFSDPTFWAPFIILDAI